MNWWSWWRQQMAKEPQSRWGWVPVLMRPPQVVYSGYITPTIQSPNHTHANGKATPPRTKLPKRAADRWFTLPLLRQAWLAVKQAKGGPGVDGITLQEFEAALDRELGVLQMELISGTYRPQPIRQVVAPKANGGMRPLAIWALRDRVAQRAVYELIAPIFEATFLPCSFGFRPGHSIQNAVAAVEERRDQNLRWVVDADIEECFERIDAARLLKLVNKRIDDRLIRHYIAAWLHAEIFNSADGVPKRAGTCQGSVLSPLLANIYLHELDQAMMHAQLAYLRYADDFLICCRYKADAEKALLLTCTLLQAQKLQLNERKTRIVHFDQGFTWLGHFFIRRECYQV